MAMMMAIQKSLEDLIQIHWIQSNLVNIQASLSLSLYEAVLANTLG